MKWRLLLALAGEAVFPSAGLQLGDELVRQFRLQLSHWTKTERLRQLGGGNLTQL
jgi:hypothetical protein